MNQWANEITDEYEDEYGEIVKEATHDEYCRVFDYPRNILVIIADTEPFSPIEDPEAHFGHMICFHNRYDLGDPHTEYYQKDPQAFMDWIDTQVAHDQIELLMLYLYDHSGITMSYNHTYPYNDRWDSGRVGIMYATLQDIRENYGVKRVTQELRQKALDHLKALVDEYDDYLTGNAYGFKLICKRCGRELDSCWGFLGDDFEKNGLLDQVGDANERCPDCLADDERFWARVDASVLAGE